jgi:hypothetical protein
VIIALPIIALMYAIMSGGLFEALADPGTNRTVQTVLGLLPSSWGAEVIVGFANNPGNISAVGFETLTRFGGLIAFFVASLWLGAKAANRAYSLELTTFTASIARPDGVFYKTVKYLGGGGSFAGLLVSVFKDYSRRLENISWLVYAVGLTAMISIFFGGESSDPGDVLFSMSLMMSPLLATFVVGTVSRGKASFFIYKKSPSGMGRFIMARMLQSCLVAVPISAVVITVSTILVPQITLIPLLTNAIWISLRTVANVAFLLGLALLIPSFSEKSRERTLSIIINMQIAIFSTIGFEIGFPRLGLGSKKIFPNLDPFLGLLFDHLLLTAVFSLLGIVLLYLGKRKLSRIE